MLLLQRQICQCTQAENSFQVTLSGLYDSSISNLFCVAYCVWMIIDNTQKVSVQSDVVSLCFSSLDHVKKTKQKHKLLLHSGFKLIHHISVFSICLNIRDNPVCNI